MRKTQQTIGGMGSAVSGANAADPVTSTIVLNQSASSALTTPSSAASSTSSSSASSASSASSTSSPSPSMFQSGDGARKSTTIAAPDSSQFTTKSMSIVGPSRNNVYLSNVITANANTQQTVQHRFGLQHGSQGPAPNVTVNPNGNFNMNTSAILKPGFAHSFRQFGLGASSSVMNASHQPTPPSAITSSKLAAQLQTINQIASNQKQASAKVPTNPSHLGAYGHSSIQSAQVQKQMQKTQQQQRFNVDAIVDRSSHHQSQRQATDLATEISDPSGNAHGVRASGQTSEADLPQSEPFQHIETQSKSADTPSNPFQQFRSTHRDAAHQRNDTGTHHEHAPSDAAVSDANSTDKTSTDDATVYGVLRKSTPPYEKVHHLNQYHHHNATTTTNTTTTNLQCLTPSSLNTSTTNINSSAALKIMVRDVPKFAKTNQKPNQKKSNRIPICLIFVRITRIFRISICSSLFNEFNAGSNRRHFVSFVLFLT